MTSKPAFLFDLDGTLADTLPDLSASTNYVREQNGLAAVDEATVRTYIGDGARTLLQRALAEREPDAQAIEAAFATYIEHHRAQCTVHSRLFPGALQYLEQLREAGHAIAVVTNKPEQFAVPVAKFLGLDSFTSVIVGGDTLPTKKPDPAMLRYALEQLGSSIDGATMVGDGLQDVRSGKRLGVRTIACLFGYGNPAALRAEGADVFWQAFAKPCID
ncbi:MAG: phosphoglycolate phosphatase [Planctomycetota bacterium]